MEGMSRRRFLRDSIAVGFVLSARPGPASAAVPGHPRSLHLACRETGESFNDIYWAEGAYLPQALTRLDWLLRDFHCDRMTRIDPRLLDLLARLAGQLRLHGPITVTSAYRTAATNAL